MLDVALDFSLLLSIGDIALRMGPGHSVFMYSELKAVFCSEEGFEADFS